MTEWIGIVSSNAGEKDYGRFIKLMQERGLLGQGEKETAQSLRLMLEMSVGRFVKAKHYRFAGGVHAKPYVSIDSFAKLVVLLVKFTNTEMRTQLMLLNTVLTISLRSLLRAADNVAADMRARSMHQQGSNNTFDQRPYLRFFSNLIHDFTVRDVALGGGTNTSVQQILALFSHILHEAQPRRAPAFASKAPPPLDGARAFSFVAFVASSGQSSPLLQTNLA